MAPKKKKKPAANARAVATTSIASKPKIDKKLESSDMSGTATPNTAPSSVTPADGTASPAGVAPAPKELHQMTPEELEQQLERNELQMLVDKYAQKVRRESSRNVSRIQTDRRLVRSQAQYLATREWLPEEIMLQVLDLAKDEINEEYSSPEHKFSIRNISEEDAMVRLWTLAQTLTDMGFSKDRVRSMLVLICQNPPPLDASNQVWGLQECLDWLAANCSLEELPPEDEGQPVSPPNLYRRQMANSTPTDSPKRSETPAPERNPGNPQKQRAASSTRQNEPSKQDDFDVSDLDSDMEPDQLLSTYLDVQTRLFQVDPELAPASNSKQKSKKSRGPQKSASVSQGAQKLQKKLQQIESDILFDSRTADEQWASKRVELVQLAPSRSRNKKAEEKTSEIPEPESTGAGAVNDIMQEAAAMAGDALLENPDEDNGLLGGIFAAEPGEGQPISTEGTESANVTVRDFGKAVGMNPRRVLEEACRARDSGVRLTFKHVSPTTYSSRHSVRIEWTKDQDPIDGSALPMVESKISPRSMTFTMKDIATPGTQQSEAYISVAAMFLIFSTSLKEEKVYMRLPSVWRDLWQEYAETQKDMAAEKDRDTIKDLRRIVQEQVEREDEDGVVLTNGFKKRGKAAHEDCLNHDLPVRQQVDLDRVSEKLQELWRQKASTPKYQHMLQVRQQLPMAMFKQDVLSAIDKNQVLILCGETGCGKSTQLPAFILENELASGRPCKIYCTEPRRISAISLAQRVSEELGEEKNAVGTARSLVGYAIRLESHIAVSTRLVYATVGIVLRMLESLKGLDDITHLVIDEVHERNIDTDFLLIILRALLVRRPELKVILMSATVDADRFSRYLDNAPILNVPGRTFPVQTKFLEDAVEMTHYDAKAQKNTVVEQEADEDDDDSTDGRRSGLKNSNLQGYSNATRNALKEYDEYRINYELIVSLIERVASDPEYSRFSNAILVFLPGIAEIRQLNDMLLGSDAFSKNWLIYPLHSTIASEDQQAAFLVPPPGIRKIVLATNIAETGITIPDITCVVDTGTHKEMRYDERRQLSRLIQSFISRANAKQRRGRAGRVQEGLCFHLFTKYRHDELMAEQQTPEMLRLSLQDLVMRVKICKLGDIEETLSQALDPPSTKNIRRAIDALIEVDALTSSEELTPLGRQLAKLPLDANLGKLCLLASVFDCVDVAVTIAAVLSSKDPFITPIGARQRADSARLSFRRGDSDLLTVYNAYATWRKICTTPGQSEFQFCSKNFLSRQNLANVEDLKSQLVSSLVEAGFLTLSHEERKALSKYRNSSRQRNFVAIPAAANTNGNNDLLVNSVISWSFYPKILTRDGKGWRNIANNQSVSLAPTSINKHPPPGTNLKFLSYYHIMQASSRFLNAHATNVAYDLPLVLLAGDVDVKLHAGVVLVDGSRLKFAVKDWKVALAVKVLRLRVKELVGATLRNPARQMTRREARWMELFLKAFERSERDARTTVGKA
ncbi:P-loop containing nucleoside triphosphate hydrolase protein [Phyllosticta paracitricarpa]|uniref:P-loop containing nucleoside triphosphate hydrolase protein n=1 Tax=Phyllosticta paracitricarpa TaxID=2016321 RepID=A0ABR1NHP6_9PEZI